MQTPWSRLNCSVSAVVLLMLMGFTSAILPIPSARPPLSERNFTSIIIEQVINDTASRMKDPDLAMLFTNCYPNTLDTTVRHFDPSGPDSFVITGDIYAQWLRDSSNQLLPYVPYISYDSKLQALVCGLIRRQSADILTDPYANSFNFANEGGPHQDDTRKPPMTKHVFEGKYELDSLMAMLKLSYAYFNYSQDLGCFDSTWLNAVNLIIATVQAQQNGTEEEGDNNPYMFERVTPVATDTLMLSGRGAPANHTGMSKCAFRPSDDAVTLPFLIPANAMAVVELKHVAQILSKLQAGSAATAALVLAQDIDQGIQEYAVVNGRYAYEVDGYGSTYSMDDANIPSLLSLPYLGYTTKTDPVYAATRGYVLSPANPYFFSGTAGKGIGGPHEGMGYIWPMAIIMQAITSNDDTEIANALVMLKNSSAGTGFLHESFWRDDVTQYTRSWFAWCNSLFGELILTIARERPYLIF